jgi:hypothetical protein
MMLMLTKADAKKFFNGLYGGRAATTSVDRGDFYEIATRIIAKSKNQTIVGPTALQALMLNYIAQQKGSKKVDIDSVSIAHISRPGVAALMQAHPNVTLQGLIDTAGDQGYEVEVLGVQPGGEK